MIVGNYLFVLCEYSFIIKERLFGFDGVIHLYFHFSEGVIFMFAFFQYNWQVRDEWLEWCKQLTTEELLMNRVGGVDNILNTLLHMIDVEYSWIRAIRGEQDVALQCGDYPTIEKVKSLSDTCRTEHEGFLKTDVHVLLNTIVIVPWDQGRFTVREILHHVIAHEIHHIGQLSVWARELHKQPVSASFLGRLYLE